MDLKYFRYEHLPSDLQRVSKPFHDLATWITLHINPSSQREVALQKLLEAKDAAVRSVAIG